jgi:hypothetical protein
MALSDSLYPNNLNPLSPNGFNFSITKLPNVSFFCQRVLIPSISLTSIDRPTPFINTPIPGEIMSFSELNIQFLIDDKMENYRAIYNWIVALAYPEDNDQYKKFVNSQGATVYSELARNYSDATVAVLDAQNNPTMGFTFYDMFPTSLDPIQLESTAMDVNYVIGSATFKYSYFTLNNNT